MVSARKLIFFSAGLREAMGNHLEISVLFLE